MQIAIHLNSPIYTTLRADCLGGEWRWERQVLEALLSSDRFDRVYSLRPAWKSKEPMPPKYIDGLPKKEEANTVCIFYNSYHVAEKYQFKGLVMQTHQAMPQPAIKTWMQTYQERFFITYDRAIREPIIQERMEIPASPWHVENIATPGIPEVYPNNNFDQDIILFPAKGITGLLRYPSFDWGQLFTWLAEKLQEDSNKKVHFLTGYHNPVGLNFLGLADLTAFRKDFLSYPQTQCLLPFQDRITLHTEIGWDEVQSLLSRTKVIVSTLCSGGIPIEAAAFGIPMVGPSGSPLAQFPDFLYAGSITPEYFKIADKLYYDREFYTQKGNAYREFVRKYYTFEAFSEKMYSLLSDRGLT